MVAKSGSCTVQEMSDALDKRGMSRAYTTVLSTLIRLYEKQLLTRELEQGSGNKMRHRYSLRNGESDLERELSLIALKQVVQTVPLSVIVDAVADYDNKLLAKLQELVRQRIKLGRC
jgi:predicted transcriptional regulator